MFYLFSGLGVVKPNPAFPNTMEVYQNSTFLWILIGVVVFLVLILVVAVALLVRWRRSAITKDYLLTHVNVVVTAK